MQLLCYLCSHHNMFTYFPMYRAAKFLMLAEIHFLHLFFKDFTIRGGTQKKPEFCNKKLCIYF